MDYFKNQASLYDIRQRALFNYIARYDADTLNVNLDAYFKIFVEHEIKVNDEAFRKKLSALNGNKTEIINLLKLYTTVPKFLLQSRFENVKIDILNYYNGILTIQRDYNIDIKPNPLGSTSIGNEDAPLNIVIFSDFLCSHCSKFHKQLKGIYRKISRLLFY